MPIAFQNLEPYCRLIRDFWLDWGFSIHYTSGMNGVGVKKKIFRVILLSGIKAVFIGRVHLLQRQALTGHVN